MHGMCYGKITFSSWFHAWSHVYGVTEKTVSRHCVSHHSWCNTCHHNHTLCATCEFYIGLRVTLFYKFSQILLYQITTSTQCAKCLPCRFSLSQNPLPKESCSFLLPVLATVLVMWRGKKSVVCVSVRYCYIGMIMRIHDWQCTK